MPAGCGVTEVSHPPGPSMLRRLTRPTMQPVRRLTQAPAYEIRRTGPAPDVFTSGTLSTPHHEWIGVRQCSLRAHAV